MKPLINILTPVLVRSWSPCSTYTDAKLNELGNEGITPLEACDLPIPDTDKLWLLLRKEIICEKDYILLGCKFAKRALHVYEKKYPGDLRVRNCIKTKELFVHGKATQRELTAAIHTAAYAAANAARAANAGYADYAAAYAANAAYSNNITNIAYAAAYATAYNAERKAQIDILRKYFKTGRV